ncbi:MAG TPA: hypothetical protein P5052_00465 [Candidatus Paceibacterota bacterium]|nr:hypothetical protein [Candidatus Paceibacterota bacterium]HRZ29277.1 hypothetical protein [Candidatus Paceibacterota bacterium]
MKDKKAGEINKEVIKKITERKKEKEQQKAADYQKMIDVIMKKLGLDEKDVALASHCELTFRTTDKGTSIDYSVIEGKINGKKIEMEENA